jgi:hypothetical protein
VSCSCLKVPRDLEVRSFAHGGVGVKWSQRGVGAHLLLKNTNREGSTRPTSSRHRALENSSLSSAPLVLFFGCATCA